MDAHRSRPTTFKSTVRRFIQRVLAALRLDVRRISFSDALVIKRRLRTDDFTFVQIGVPSRSELESYGAIESEIDRRVAELNAKHGVRGLAPPDSSHQNATQSD